MAGFDPALAPGTLFAGRYQIIEEAGRGGMGIVYKALDTTINERIALKILAPEIADDATGMERFRRELKSARQVTHANVVRVHDLGQAEGIAYLTMEFAPGQTLRSVLGMAGRLNPQTAVEYARQICDGLAAAHRAGIIHRDLKPQNLMVDDRHRLRIMDFGIARPLAGSGPTREGAMIGTPAYMAPEQVEGRDVDGRTDLYALGVILFEMTTGRLPFEAESNRAMARRRLESAAPSPASINPAIPASLDALILRCLVKEPSARPASAEALGVALAEIAAEIDPAAPAHPSVLRPTPSAALRSRRAPSAAVAAGLIILAALGAYLFIFRGSGPPPPAGWTTRLAVLPLVDGSPGRDQAVLCDGMTHGLRGKLAAAGGLKIISEYSSNQFPGSPTGLAEIGRTLGARHILTGSLNIHDGMLTAEFALGDAQTGAEIWKRPYGGKVGDYFAIQALIADDVGERLAAFRTVKVAPTPSAADPASLEAYTDYLMGRRFEARYRDGDAAADFEDAAKLYRGALAHDARYTPALRGLGDLHEARFVKAGDPTDQALMLENYRNAFETNPALPDSMIAMGWSYFYQQNQEEAARYFKRARDAAPEQAPVLLSVGAYLRSIGLYEKAVVYLERAGEKSRETDPLSTNPAFQLAGCRGFLGQAAEAERILRGLGPAGPSQIRVRILLARQLLAQRKTAEARAELEAIGNPSALASTLRRAYDLNRLWLEAASGNGAEALRLIRASDRPFGYEIVNAYCLLGRKEEALASIRDGIDRGFLVVKDYLYRYPYLIGNKILDVLRADPRFRKILAKQKDLDTRLNAICAGL
ncbi:MAG: protein kinase [Candidatus Aminicenantes bacterium]|nr:protein kinase [Candidatus Aminicenantes bacterium]